MGQKLSGVVGALDRPMKSWLSGSGQSVTPAGPPLRVLVVAGMRGAGQRPPHQSGEVLPPCAGLFWEPWGSAGALCTGLAAPAVLASEWPAGPS